MLFQRRLVFCTLPKICVCSLCLSPLGEMYPSFETSHLLKFVILCIADREGEGLC